MIYKERQCGYSEIRRIMVSKVLFCIFGLVTSAHWSLANINAVCNYVEGHRNLHLLAPKSTCGVAKKGFTQKIMGGELVGIGQMPWMVSLRALGVYEDGSLTTLHFCGGTLISARHVLTAAHCLKPILDKGLAKTLFVRVGDKYKDNYPDCDDKQCLHPYSDYDVEHLIVHRGFDMDIGLDDIGLLKLTQKVEFNDLAQPICLPTSCDLIKEDLVGKQATTAGWGFMYGIPPHIMKDGERLSKFYPVKETTGLRKLSVEIKNRRKSCPFYEVESNGLITKILTTKSQLCVGATETKSGCQGDSGGPLFYNTFTHGASRHVQIGITSNGDLCVPDAFIQQHYGRRRINAIYTNVASYMPWILQNLSE